MNRLWSKLLLGALLAISAAQFTASSSKADDYWDGHWRWYDNSYRPYYQRHYYRNPYGGYRYYGPSTYYGNGYYNGGYYNAPPAYYYPGGGGVQVGPLRFGWW